MINKKVAFFIVLLVMASVIAVAEPEVRRIVPPKLESVHLGQKIIYYRPMRHGSPNMSVEKKSDKVIVHNYGHGGSGWTLAPGSATYVNDLLLQSPEASNLKKDTPITIIGAGVVGLFVAYDLEQKGFQKITIIAQRFKGLASHVAGGLLAPVSMDNSPELQKVVDRIGIDAYQFYATIAQKKHRDFEQGAKIIPAYFETREESGLEPYVGKVMQPAKDVILDFGNGTKRKMVAYDDGIFIDAEKMMESLFSFIKRKNIKMIQEKVHSFDDLQDQFIINCTGLGAADLNRDSQMVSVQGHLRMLKDQNPQDLQYMVLIYLGEGKTITGQKVKRLFYIFPKQMIDAGQRDVGVIGGTFIEGATAATSNNEEFDIMLQEAKEFYGMK